MDAFTQKDRRLMARGGLAFLGLGMGMVAGCSSGDEAARGSGDAITLAVPELPAACRTPEIVSLERPQSSVDPARGSFTYRLRFRKPAQDGLPTVVHLPGGPGLPSIGEDAAWVPANFGLV